MNVLHYSEDAVSVAFEEVDASDWAERVYRPDIRDKWDQVYKKPGYEMWRARPQAVQQSP